MKKRMEKVEPTEEYRWEFRQKPFAERIASNNELRNGLPHYRDFSRGHTFKCELLGPKLLAASFPITAFTVAPPQIISGFFQALTLRPFPYVYRRRMRLAVSVAQPGPQLNSCFLGVFVDLEGQ